MGEMSFKQKLKMLDEECNHIPEGEEGSSQGELRKVYREIRTRGMGVGIMGAKESKTKEECLKDAIETVRRNHPDLDPKFDRGFFKI